jgi:hypothetical protein
MDPAKRRAARTDSVVARIERTQVEKNGVMKMNLKIEAFLAIAAIACAAVALPAKDTPYPSEKLAAFVVEKLDVTSLPTSYRPKKQKGKKTLTDYGYTVQKLDETEALVEGTGGTRKLSIKILQEGPSGIYACMAQANRDGHDPEAQSVVLLQRKGSSDLLTGRETWREFKSCPVIGESDSSSPSAGGD